MANIFSDDYLLFFPAVGDLCKNDEIILNALRLDYVYFITIESKFLLTKREYPQSMSNQWQCCEVSDRGTCACLDTSGGAARRQPSTRPTAMQKCGQSERSKGAQEGKGSGGTAELIERLLDKTRKPQVDWRRVLNAFVQQSVCDYSFAPPDRRFAETDFFLPDLSEREFVTKEILFMADTSASVGGGDLATVYSELRGAIEPFGGKLCGKLGFFDTRVTKPLPFEAVGDLSRIRPYGGGGTDFRVIFDYLYEECRNDLPACLVIFTDGYGPYPDEADTMRVPVLWIINNQRITPPFGKVTRLLGSTLYEN